MKKVIIESPYAGDIEANVKYARACVKDSLMRGECPLASHLLYTQEGILDDNIAAERQMGIAAGLEWLRVADMHVFYIDTGFSKGMRYALEYSQKTNMDIKFRKLYPL